MGVFTMPSLGADMEAGTLIEWLVAPGEEVKRGDVVAVVETQKGAIEIEIFETGIVRELLAEPGQILPVGAPMAGIDNAEQSIPQPEQVQPVPRAEPPARVLAAPLGTPSQGAASPAARERARQTGVDLAQLQGSGPGGAVLLADVEAARTAFASAAAPLPRDAMRDAMRDAIAAAMTRSKQTIPHFYMTHRFDVEPVFRYLDAHNAEAPPEARILFGAVVIRAVALACRKVPGLNGTWSSETGYCSSQAVNVGVAIALRGGGLVAPAIRAGDDLDLAATMQAMRDLVTRARGGRLRSSEMTSATITVSGLGDRGVEEMTGVIFPPQVALVGVGVPQLRPWVLEEGSVARRVRAVTLSADHRVGDGRQASEFLMTLEDIMQHPEAL